MRSSKGDRRLIGHRKFSAFCIVNDGDVDRNAQTAEVLGGTSRLLIERDMTNIYARSAEWLESWGSSGKETNAFPLH